MKSASSKVSDITWVPADAIVQNGATIPYPLATRDLHHEIELVVALGKGEGPVTDLQDFIQSTTMIRMGMGEDHEVQGSDGVGLKHGNYC